MLLRKALSAYLTSFAIVIYYSLLLTGADHPDMFPRFGELMQWISFISLYVFPIVLLYGSLVSMAMDFVTRRWVRNGSTARMLASCAGHMLFGALFALPFGSTGFILSCAAGALLFFGADRLLETVFARGWRKPAITIAIAVPIAAIAGLGFFSSLGDGPGEQAPFTEADAVAFATDGQGTVTDVFPKQAGSAQTVLSGYTVTRETSVVTTGREKYEVTFREQWNKDGQDEGSRWFTYVVTRRGMASKGSGGDAPPY
ncbi:hypothetical protein [Paenibacillus soyae]|uniref:Uncharacterized protein n=1 Tax=Paenibacillus soyae TaxID=2969249 RepID=A0A9X2SBP7_9BACL|nr:hypothetical protein [Paenibacillus soyae]MCR2805177.1 hypothetical protein [Paenibacillus soyae]